MAKFLQIIDVETDGRETILHPETTADYVEAGSTYKVPKISEISNWEAKSKEIEAARKGLPNLKGKIDAIDTSLQAANLLSTIKGVDGSGSGLDADLVDGKNVNDEDVSTSSLWTANKIAAELNKKTNAADVVGVATPNKILKLNSDGVLPANVKGNASTASAFNVAETINLTGDVTGQLVVKGGQTKSVSLSVVDDSHNHSGLVNGNPVELKTTGSGNIADFKVSGSIRSSIDNKGNFTGQAASVQGYTVSDGNPSQLWTGKKIQEEIGKAVKEVVQKDTSKSELRLGIATIKYGTVDIATTTTVTIQGTAPSAMTTIIAEGYTVVSSDNSITYVKAPGEGGNITLNFNKRTPSGAKLKWFIISV